MRSSSRWGWLSGSVVVTAMLVAGGVIFTGCSPGPEQPAGPAGGSGPSIGPPSGTAQEPAITEEPETREEPTTAKEPATTEEPTTTEEPAATEGKAEPKAPEAPAASEEPTSAKAEPPSGAVESPAAPPVSEFAPAGDLVAQVQAYLEDLEETVATEEAYNDAVLTGKIDKDSNTLILIALALGLHDSDNQYKAAAPAVVKASQQLAAAKDYASAKAAVEAVKAATTSTEGDPAALKWEKVASLKALMEAVPLIDSRVKRYVRKGREDRMKKAADDLAGYAAVLAVIAHGSMANSGETDKPDEAKKWHGYCIQMRDAAAGLNTAVRTFQKDATPAAFEVATTALQGLGKSCDDCHEVFHPEALAKTQTEATDAQ